MKQNGASPGLDFRRFRVDLASSMRVPASNGVQCDSRADQELEMVLIAPNAKLEINRVARISSECSKSRGHQSDISLPMWCDSFNGT